MVRDMEVARVMTRAMSRHRTRAVAGVRAKAIALIIP